MKKRILSIVLACLMVLPLATFHAGASSSDAKTIDVNSLPQKADLIDLLEWLELYIRSMNGNIPAHAYDCRTITSRNDNTFEYLIWFPMEENWRKYPGTSHDFEGKTGLDPLRRFSKEGLYMKASKAKVDWIMTNIFNCSQNDLNVLKARWKKESLLNGTDWSSKSGISGYGYEQNGYYYSLFCPSMGDYGWAVTLKSAKYDGTYYYVEFDATNFTTGRPERNYATLGLKTIDGKTYWSIFADSFNGFVYFDSVAGFYDVQGTDWFANDVKYVVDKKLMNGTSDQYFTPSGKTTRGQAVTILYRLAGSPKVSGVGSFTDVKSGTWYSEAVQWAVKNSIASGYGNGKFGPNDTLNRQQLATMLIRYAHLKNYDTKPSGDLSKFNDGNKVDSYAKTAMEWAVVTGLISGSSDGNLNPNGPATRAQLAAILHRFAENVRTVEPTIYNDDREIKLKRSFENCVAQTKSTTYNPELSYYLAALARAAYNDRDIDNSLRSLGFDSSTIRYGFYEKDSIIAAYSIAKKTIGGKTLVLITVRGTSNGWQWATDLNLGTQAALTTGWHEGFERCEKVLMTDLKQFLGGIPKSNVIYVLTGHSLGAAVANLTSVKLFDAGVPSTNVYDYNFACPDVANGLGTRWNHFGEHNNMFNIGNCQDPITYVPGVIGDLIGVTMPMFTWGKFGQSYWFSTDWSRLEKVGLDVNSHDAVHYVDFLASQKPISSFRTIDGINTAVLKNQLKTILGL